MELTRDTRLGVTLLEDASRPHGVTLAFTERTGGCSAGRYASLNLGDACGDDAAAVEKNRMLALEAVGAGKWATNLVNPKQVHGDHVVVVRSCGEAEVAAAIAEARSGADAVVCIARHVPVLLCFADCVPVVLVAPGGFAVVHSGWRGTIARIAAKAARVLAEECGCEAADVSAYIGPHVTGEDYEVSQELLDSFVGEFGPSVRASERHLDLACAIRAALEDEGVDEGNILDCGLSTAGNVGRFFSYRAEDGRCGRHGAIACLCD
ncbi:polyphenol oxidase family protein [Parafannyhessea umbonata]|uniref:Laccase domain-containing protein n=1 Tax=Parafannyhessea umbonata TaxID=604330 RepID=A0A1H1L2F5_9ACTN|nr:polyphenol oxidase family protein [Parafannyhessea umbonata]SDR68462.1 conserved hypothetical protein [Parafannyhessea umbonata]